MRTAYNARSMRSTAFHRRMSCLALVAMLLLSALPTLGRLSAGPGASDGMWAQICTMAGLKLVKLAPGDANPLDPPPAPAGDGGAMPGPDCAYCPLLAAVVVLLLAIAFASPARARGIPAEVRRRAPWKFRHPNGLGSRGPPIAL